MLSPTITHANITGTPTFLKLTEQTFGEIVINTSAITFVCPASCKVCVQNTNSESGAGMLELTEESMAKLLHALGCDGDK